MVHDHVSATGRSSSSDRGIPMHHLIPALLDHRAYATSREGVRRIARVAVEAAARFADAEDDDAAETAMDWLDAPRALFGGLSALDSCADPVHCARAVALHGFGMDPEVDADEVDLLMSPLSDEPDEVAHGACPAGIAGDGLFRLFVSEISHEENGFAVWAFAAMVADDEARVRSMLEARYGAGVAASSVLRQGFDASEGLARTLLSPRLAETLAAVSADPSSPVARGLEIVALVASDPDLRVLRRAVTPPPMATPRGTLLLSCCAVEGDRRGGGDCLRYLSLRPFRTDAFGTIVQIGAARRWTTARVLREPRVFACETVCDAEAGSLLADAELIVAHGAKSIRPLVEQAFVVAKGRPWICTRDDVDWPDMGLERGTLSAALHQTGNFLGADGAEGRVEGLLHLLAHRPDPAGSTLLGGLLGTACRSTWLVEVEDLPPVGERMVASAGYALIPGTRRWWRELRAESLDPEVEWLTWQVCGGSGRPRVREIGWRTRHTVH